MPQVTSQPVALGEGLEGPGIPLDRVEEVPPIGESATDPDRTHLRWGQLPLRHRGVDLQVEPAGGELARGWGHEGSTVEGYGGGGVERQAARLDRRKAMVSDPLAARVSAPGVESLDMAQRFGGREHEGNRVRGVVRLGSPRIRPARLIMHGFVSKYGGAHRPPRSARGSSVGAKQADRGRFRRDLRVLAARDRTARRASLARR